MTVIDIQPRVAHRQIRELEKIAACIAVLIDHEDLSEEARARKEKRLEDVREQIDDKRQRLEKEVAGEPEN